MTPDTFTMSMRLCDDAGMVADDYLGVLNRLRALSGHKPYEGAAFPCTGSAHLAGEHIRCTSTAHATVAGRDETHGFTLDAFFASRQAESVTCDALPERPARDENPLPEDLERLLRDPNIAIPQDEGVHEVIVADLQRHPERTVPRNAYLNLWALYKAATLGEGS